MEQGMRLKKIIIYLNKKKSLINKNDKIFFDKYFCFGNYEKIYIKKKNFCQKVFL